MSISFPERPIDLIAMGRVAVDLYAEQIGAPLKDAQTFRKYLGGCAGNIAVGSARLGLKVSMLSAVGTDAFGDFVVETLAREGVDISALQRTSAHLTGLVALGVCPPDHFPLIFFRNECADLYIDTKVVDPEYIKGAKALLITGTAFSHEESARTTFHVMSLARAHHTKIIFDIDYRPVLWGLTALGNGEDRYVASERVTKALETVLPFCDLIVGTEEEITIAGGAGDFLESLTELKKRSHASIVVKKGLHGSEFHADGETQKFKAYPVPVLNVLGAGDAFMSGLLSSMVRGGSSAEAFSRANACGAIVVSRHGCAPAMPSLDEVQFFQAHYEETASVLKQPQLEKLHRRVSTNNKYRLAPLPIMAFCHRWQLEESCQKFNKPFSKIREFKTAIARSMARLKGDVEHACILTDPIYGQDAIREAERAGLDVIVPIEKSGTYPTQWLEPWSAYEIVLKNPPSWGVKVLWPMHPDLPEHEEKQQYTRLKEIARAAAQLERRWMLEVVAPAGFRLSDKNIVDIMSKVYHKGITPYWWKLPAFQCKEEWHSMAQLIDEFDNSARVVILGGEAKSIESFAQAFHVAQSTHHGVGFAVGRSIFWPSWIKFIQGEWELFHVEEEIARKYKELYQLWLR